MADKNKALDAAVSQIERAFGKGSIMRMGARSQDEQIEVIPSGSLGAGHRAGHRRPAARPHHRGLRAGKLGQDDAGPARDRRSTEARRHLRLHRRGTCAGPDLRPQAWRGRGQSADQPAGRRRAGAGNLRHAGPLRRHRRAGGRFGGRPWCRAPSWKARWATRMWACMRG